MTDLLCPYCGNPAELTDSAAVYHGRSYGMIYLCAPCDAYVGVHKNSPDHRPLGRLANAELRAWRKRAHAAFDPLWQTKRKFGHSKRKARGKGYRWLAHELGIAVEDCHIAHFDVEQCKRVVEICEPILRKLHR